MLTVGAEGLAGPADPLEVLTSRLGSSNDAVCNEVF